MNQDEAVEIRVKQGLTIDATPKPAGRVVSVRRTYSVDRAEPMELEFTRRRFRPTDVEVLMDNRRGYPATVTIKVKGPRVLTNGRDGVDKMGRAYYGNGPDAPNWLRDLADQALAEEWETLR